MTGCASDNQSRRPVAVPHTTSTMNLRDEAAPAATGGSWLQRNRNFVVCHSALLLCQLIFATNLTFTRAAFQFSHGVVVSPMTIVVIRTIIAFSVVAMSFHRESILRAALSVRRHARNLTCGGSGCDSDERRSDDVASAVHVAEVEASAEPATHHMTRRAHLRIALVGFVVACSLAGFAFGLRSTDALTAGAVLCAIPPLSLTLSALLGVERFSLFKLLSVTLAIVGNAVMISAWELFSGSQSRPTSYYIGVCSLLAYSCFWASFLVLQKPILATVPRMAFLYYLYRAVIVFVLIFGLIFHEEISRDLFSRWLPFWVVAAIWYAGFISAVVPYYLTAMAMSLSSPVVVATYSVLQPLIVAVEAVIFLNESLSATKVLGGLTALSAVAVAATSQYRDAAKREAAKKAAANGVMLHVADATCAVAASETNTGSPVVDDSGDQVALTVLCVGDQCVLACALQQEEVARNVAVDDPLPVDDNV